MIIKNKLVIAGGIIILGICWWVVWNEIDREGRKKASDCSGGVSSAQIKPVKVYVGAWREYYLEVIGKDGQVGFLMLDKNQNKPELSGVRRK